MPKKPELWVYRFPDKRIQEGSEYVDSWTPEELIAIDSVHILGGKLLSVVLGNRILYQSDSFCACFGPAIALPGMRLELRYSGYSEHVRPEVHYTKPDVG